MVARPEDGSGRLVRGGLLKADGPYGVFQTNRDEAA